MSKNSLYLKYRPAQLEEVVGHKFIMATFKQASIQNKFAHAYLLTGVKGSGKTTTARILANLMTCLAPKDGKTCGKCISCTTVPSGFAPDVVELDGAANGNIENVQGLIEGAQWHPSALARTVYIIDECHQLSSKAISALLKIVEEPPEHLVFIFCTTEPEKIPDTILSRAQRFKFRRIPVKDIVGRLRYIADKEKINVDDAALYLMAKISRGCMRDAIVPLEQISTLVVDKAITEAQVVKYFGLPDRQAVMSMAQSIVKGDISLLMDQVNDMVVASADPKDIAYEISELFRSMMLLKSQGGNSDLVELPDHEINQLKEVLGGLNMGQLVRLSHIFSTLKKELSYSINERWVLESALIQGVAILRKQDSK